MKIDAKEFSNKSITVTYDPSICKLSCKCTQELPEVFMSSVIPWVDLNAASAERIEEQVKRCPSGALKFYNNKELNGGLQENKKALV